MTVLRNKVIPDDAREALEWWDAGAGVFTIEMGGLGPGYEQVIHIAVFESIRELLDKDIPEDKDELNDLFDAAVSAASIDKELHLSGAQAGAAKNLAYQFLSRPWNDVLNDVERDRRIQVSKSIPNG